MPEFVDGICQVGKKRSVKATVSRSRSEQKGERYSRRELKGQKEENHGVQPVLTQAARSKKGENNVGLNTGSSMGWGARERVGENVGRSIGLREGLEQKRDVRKRKKKRSPKKRVGVRNQNRVGSSGREWTGGHLRQREINNASCCLLESRRER